MKSKIARSSKFVMGKPAVLSAAACMLALSATAAVAGPKDLANGACDSLRGKSKSYCVKAYGANRLVEKLEAKGSTMAALEKAKGRLVAAMDEFEALTGYSVPGLEPSCNIAEINDWVAENQALEDQGILAGMLATDQGNGTVTDNCRVTAEFTPAHSASHTCTRVPVLNFNGPDTLGFVEANTQFIYYGAQVPVKATHASAGRPISDNYLCFTVTLFNPNPPPFSLGGGTKVEGTYTQEEVNACARVLGCPNYQ